MTGLRSEDPSLLHVDLDAFFASVEQLVRPELRGLPVVVGGTGRRGVVAAASYEARRFGVRSAMPTAQARRLCPPAAFLPPRPGLYREYSDRVFAILRAVTPRVEPLSLDEAFLDVSGARRLLGSAPEVAELVKERVRDETGLVCSVGVASTKLVAKLASDASKPDGLLVVQSGEELDFLWPLPVDRLWGVGPATCAKLERLGVRTVGDLARVPEDTLVTLLGPASGSRLHALAHNRDARSVDVEGERKPRSVSAEETFADDVTDSDRLQRETRRLAERVGERLREGGRVGRSVSVKVRFADFRTVTRATTLPEPTDTGSEIAAAALPLLLRLDIQSGVRLVGVAVTGLAAGVGRQEPLPFGGDTDRRALDAAVDAVKQRFGADSVGPASLVDGSRLRTGRRTDHAWGPDE